MTSQYFIGGMMPELAIPGNSLKRSSRFDHIEGGWQCFEGPGVGPYWTGESAKDDAIGYAKARAQFGRVEIRVLNHEGSAEHVISFDARQAGNSELRN
jgi:hypothetical protein